MEFYLILEMSGNFPGSPDKVRIKIPERIYDYYMKQWGFHRRTQ